MKEELARCLLEKTRDNYNLIAENFSLIRKNPWLELKFLFEKYASAGDKIFDFGCGAGQYFEFLKDKKIEYFGADISDKLIKIAQGRYPQAHFKTTDGLNMDFTDNFFDKVFMVALLHNVPSDNFREKILKEAKRVLKPDGVLILTVWNLGGQKRVKKLIGEFIFKKILGQSQLDFFDILMDWMGMKKCYFHCFKKSGLEFLVKKNNFKILESGEFRLKDKINFSNFYIAAKNVKI